MLFVAKLEVFPMGHHPESTAIQNAVRAHGYDCVREVTKGKVFEIRIDAGDAYDASVIANLLCMNFFVEPNTEKHRIVSVRPG